MVSGHGGGTISKRMLLAMIIIFNVSLLSLGNISATDTNYIEPTTVSETANNTDNNTDIQSGNFSNNTDNYNTENTNSSTSAIQSSMEAAGGDDYSNVHGIWLTSSSVNTVDIDALLKAGITDIFVKTNRISDPTYQSVLNTILAKVNGTPLRIHAWITCFKDANGNWIDPQGKYSYQAKVSYSAPVKVAYKKYWYKKWYKKWYKYKGKWKYKWKYKWIYKWLYKTVYVTKYKYETKYGYNSTYKNTLVSFISNITSNYSISGIHLDYLRYSGSGNSAAYLNSGGTESITSFVANVTSTVKGINAKMVVSAALMPEGAENAKYYGQNYTQLSQYLDFLVPMIYKGNYNQDTDWIGKTVKYIVDNSNGKPVVAGLQTYESDTNTTPIPAVELQNDIDTAIANGSSGYALFRYGLIDSAYMPVKEILSESSTNSQFTLSSIQIAAASVKSYIETNHSIPSVVTVGSVQVTSPQFLQLLVKGLLQIENGVTTPLSVDTINNPTNPTGNYIYGNISLSEYLSMAEKIKSFIDLNEIAPNYSSSSLGNVQYSDLIYMYSKILNYYNTNQALPNYVILDKSVSNSTIPTDIQQYLKTTTNCEVTDSKIKALAASITKGLYSSYDKAVAIFNWVRNNISYSFYYNTKYGAVGTLDTKTGNCVDTTHLLVALMRTVGIPARYAHVKATFTSGNVYGHVYANVWVNGKWYYADATSSKNTLGTIANWNTTTSTLKGIYASLPF